MKKLFVMVCAVAAMALTSCNSGQTNAGADADSTNVEATEDIESAVKEEIAGIAESVEAGDQEAIQTKIEAIKAKVQSLIDEGKLEEAQKYAEKFKVFLEENQEKIAAVSPALGELASTVSSNATGIVSAAAAALDATANGAKDAATDIANEAVDAANAKVDEAKEAVNNKVEETKAAANAKAQEAVDGAKQKANEAIDKAANDLKSKIGL